MQKLEFDSGQFTWIPEWVIFEGKKYSAPLDLLPILTYRTMLEYLVERKEKIN